MVKKTFLVAAIWALVFLCVSCFGADEKISLAILYAGHPQSEREADFVRFLKQHFARVETGDLGAFKEQDANGYDVVILDYDGKFTEAPDPKISKDYTRATVTIAGRGARIGSSLKLKTGYT